MVFPLAAAPRRAGRHAEQGAGFFVNAAFRAEASLGYRIDNPIALRQRSVQPSGAHAFRIAARRQAGVIAEHPQKVKAGVAGPLRQYLQRWDVLIGLDKGTGVAYHRLRDAGTLTFWVTAFAGAKTSRLGLWRGAEEPDIFAQGPWRRTAWAAEHAHASHGVKEVCAGVAGEDLIPEMLFRDAVDGVSVLHGGNLPQTTGLTPSADCLGLKECFLRSSFGPDEKGHCFRTPSLVVDSERRLLPLRRERRVGNGPPDHVPK